MQLEKVTNGDLAAAKRRYDDACGTAHGLDLIGERWALLVVREMLLGPKRFSDLRSDLPGISANVLTQRLERLEETGLVTRRRLPPPAKAQVYELTPWGYEAEPIIQTLGRWAVRSPGHDATLPISATSIMLSFRTWWDERKTDGFPAAVGFRLGSESFVATPAGPELKVARADPAGAQAVFIGEPSALGAAAYGKQPLAALESAGLLRVEGDIALARRFLSLFELPPKAG
jgi:DNA-binding HxlR family transcriptional regulator